jgi:hypothetical protein
MTKKEAERLAKEAKHSMAIFMGFLGASNSGAVGLFLKWPDALDSFVSGDDELFKKDMAVLITEPVKLVVESLAVRTKNTGIGLEIEDAMRMARTSPIATKLNLIRFGNIMIEKLNAHGKVMIPIGAYLEDPNDRSVD